MNGDPRGKTDLPTAIAHYEAGRLAEARTLCGKILNIHPAHAPTRHLLGVICLQTDRIDEAVSQLSQAADLAPGNPQIIVACGGAFQAAGRLKTAEQHYRQALAINPELPDAHNNLGTVLLDLNRPKEAMAPLENALDLNPDYVDALYNLGNAHGACGNPERAIEQYRRALSLVPEFADAHTNLGLALLETEEPEDAVQHLRRAVDLLPGATGPLKNLATALGDIGELDEAENICLNVLNDRSDDVDALNQLGEIHRLMRRFEDAEQIYRRVLAIDKDNLQAGLGAAYSKKGQGDLNGAMAAHHQILASGANLAVCHAMLGEILVELDRVAEANNHFRQAIGAEPSGLEGAKPLITALRHVGGDQELARLQAMVRNPTLAQKDLAEAHLAVAGIYDSRGLVHQAFPYFAAGNEIKSRRSQYRPEIHTQFTDRIVSVFDGTLFDRMRPFGVHNRLPLFVIGMPRSGTTLVEQILASHSRIVGAGELHDIGNIAGTIRQRAQVPEFFPESTLALSSVMAPEFAESYLERISGLGPDASRVTDKMPDNYQFLGLIALLLPDARIIHCRRDPLDTCLSCYLTNFAGEMGFARNLAHLGACYRDYERLMDHWRRVLPLPILDVHNRGCRRWFGIRLWHKRT